MYTDWWASIRSNCFRKKFFKTLYTLKHTIEQSMRTVKVQWVVGFKQKQGLPGEVFKNNIHIQSYNWKKCALCQSNKVTWVVGFKQKQWLSEEVFLNFIHMQTYNWTKYALCESTPSGGLQAEAMAFRSFSKHYTHSNIQLNKVCALWKYSEWWASIRSNGFPKKFFKTLFTSKHTIEKSVRSVKVTKYFEWWASSRNYGFQKFFKTLFTFKQTIEQNMRSVEVHRLVGFKQKQWRA